MKAAVLVPVMILIAAFCGCYVPDPPPPEAVLEGTWELTGDAFPNEITDFLITFNEEGEITAIIYRYNDVKVSVTDPQFVQSNSTVDGTDVSIVATWFSVNNLVFSGTLNAEETQITGSATFKLVIGSVTVEVPLGDAQLVKQ